MSLHECRIYDGTGKLKQTVGYTEVNEKYWYTFLVEHADYAQLPAHLKQGKQRSYTITCKVCKKEAQAIRKHAKYCSSLCKGRRGLEQKKARLDAAAGRKYALKCKICEKDWKSIRPTYKYCSPKCKTDANNEKNRRASENSKTHLAQRKLELIKRKKKILQFEHSPSLEGGEVREAHSVQTS